MRFRGSGSHKEAFPEEVMRGLLASSLTTASLDETGWHDTGEGPGSREADFIDWLTIPDLEASVVEDVERIRRHPLVPRDIPIYGCIYQVETGKLIQVPEAMELGKAA